MRNPAFERLRPAGDSLVQQAVIDNRNVFEMLVDAVRVCSLGQITHALTRRRGWPSRASALRHARPLPRPPKAEKQVAAVTSMPLSLRYPYRRPR